jgi:hypothetical protein
MLEANYVNEIAALARVDVLKEDALCFIFIFNFTKIFSHIKHQFRTGCF